MALTIQQLEAFSNTKPELRYITEEIIKYLTSNPPNGEPSEPQPIQRYQGNTIIGLGDSITASNGYYFNLLTVVSRQQLQFLRNAGVSGNNTSDMLARIDADVIAYSPNYCIILGGTNDTGSISLATSIANLTAMYTRLREANIEPIACTIPPRSGVTVGDIILLNEWIRGYAQKNGIICLDFYQLLVDPTTNQYQTALTSDSGVHPSPTGARMMAEYASTILTKFLPYHAPPISATTGDTKNLMLNGLCITDTNSDGMPDNWDLYNGSATGLTLTLIADPEGHGKLMNVVTSSPSGGGYGQLLSSGFTNGDIIAVSGRIITTGAEAGPLIWSVQVQFPSAGQTVTILDNLKANVDGVFYQQMVCQGTSVRPLVFIHSGTVTGTIKFGQFTVRNLTVLGIPTI